MTAVTFLGTAPGQPRAGSAHASILLERDDSRVLLDAGEPCSTRLRELGVPLASISHVLITHGHADHVGGLPLFLQGCYLEKRQTPLTIVTPASISPALQAWLEALFLTSELVRFPLVFETWEASEKKQCGPWRVRAFRTTHLDMYRPQLPGAADPWFNAYGFVLQAGDLRLVHSGDIGALRDLDEPLAKPTSLTICEATHMEDGEIFDFLRRHSTHRFALTHYAVARLDRLAEFRQRVHAACPNTIVDFAEDGVLLRVDQLSPPEQRRPPAPPARVLAE